MLPLPLGPFGVRSLGRGEERGQRRLELGLRIGLALLGVEEARTVDQAGVAWPQQIRAVVAKVEPGARIRKTLAARLLYQLLQIGGRGRRGRPGKANQDGDDEAESRRGGIRRRSRAQAMT